MATLTIRLPTAPPQAYLAWVTWWREVEELLGSDMARTMAAGEDGAQPLGHGVRSIVPEHVRLLEQQARQALAAGTAEISPELSADTEAWDQWLDYWGRRREWLEALALRGLPVPQTPKDLADLWQKTLRAMDVELAIDLAHPEELGVAQNGTTRLVPSFWGARSAERGGGEPLPTRGTSKRAAVDLGCLGLDVHRQQGTGDAASARRIVVGAWPSPHRSEVALGGASARLRGRIPVTDPGDSARLLTPRRRCGSPLALSHGVLQSTFQWNHPGQTREFEHRADGRPERGNDPHLLPSGLESFREAEKECQAGTVEIRRVGEIHDELECAVRHGRLDSSQHLPVIGDIDLAMKTDDTEAASILCLNARELAHLAILPEVGAASAQPFPPTRC